jgi:hypothetical protein
MRKIFITVITFIIFITIIPPAFAGPQSTTYELMEYGFGAGGEASISSTTYSLFGTAGEIDMATLSSNTYRAGGGLNLTLQAAVPPGPTVTNPGSNYDRLHIIVGTGGNPLDTLYALSLTDGITTYFVQNDRTIGTTLGLEDWLPYAGDITVGWGDSSGFDVTRLNSNTTYTIFVKAKQGKFTESAWGPGTTATTSNPSFTFGVDSSTVTFSNLNSGNSYTDSSKTTVLTTSTNASSGYIIYGYETQPLTHTIDGTKTISDYAGTNSSPTSWVSTGFGYTTNDSSLTGGTADRFTNGGPNYAGFGLSGPGDPVADHAGPVTTPVSNETFSVSYRVTASAVITAGQYRTTVIYVAVPTY